MRQPDFVSETLVHWTGRAASPLEAFDRLRSICESMRLRMPFCQTHAVGISGERIRMVCFTDVPLAFAAPHCEAFGSVGIGFKKQAMINFGAAPVLYTPSKHDGRVLAIKSLLATMRDMEKDREWKADLEPYHFSEDETLALRDIIGLTQEYSHAHVGSAPSINYYQREWRLLFDTLPFAGDQTPQNPGMTCFDGQGNATVAFASSDVDWLIVPRAYEARAIPLATPLGCEVRIFEDTVRG
jgi:hypothetical protein